MYQALYRSFRPDTFDSLWGQEHIVRILRNQIDSGSVGHAYLFCGTRGTGKTTTARILAKGVNCVGETEHKPCGVCPNCVAIRDGLFMDVIEIDAASNNGVENVRELRESVQYAPFVGRCKVYIIDEVHMLSSQAFNALLKTLEEPPENVMFILATTEPQKLPATILSRCLRLDFRRVPERRMREGLRKICGDLSVKISESALGLVAANADGSVRDALSLLDQCISGGGKEIARQDILDVLGTAGEEVFIELSEQVELHHVAEALLLVNRVMEDGKDVRQFMKDWMAHYRSLLMTKFIRNPEDVLNMSEENVARIRKQAESIELPTINRCILKLSETLAEAKWTTQPRVLLELAVVQMAGGGEGAALPLKRQQVPIPTAASKGETQTATAAQAVAPAIAPIPEALQRRMASDQGEEMAAPKTATIPATAQQMPSAVKAEEAPEAKLPLGVPEPIATVAEQEALLPNGEQAGQIPETAGTVTNDDIDLDALWHMVFEDGETMKGSFNLLRGASTLQAIGGSTFTVEISSPVAERYIKDNSRTLEALMEKHVGRPLRMEYKKAAEEEVKEESLQGLADQIGSHLGVNVEIE